MARIFLGVMLFTLLALCIACGGVPATPTTSSGMQGPQNSTAVDRGNQTTPADDSQLEHDATAANHPAEDDRQDSPPADPYQSLVIDWIQRGRPEISYQVGSMGSVPHLETIQVLGPDACLCLVGNTDQVIALKDLSTSGMVDGHTFGVKLARVQGTAQYENILGSTNTVFVLVAMGTTDAEAEIYRQAQQAELERMAEVAQQKEDLRESQYRTWTSADGQFAIEARLDNFALGTATLERRDGTTVEVPEEKLSDDDQLYIQEEFQRRAKAAREIRRMEQ